MKRKFDKERRGRQVQLLSHLVEAYNAKNDFTNANILESVINDLERAE